MKVINDLDKSHVSGLVGMNAESEEVRKRMAETMSVGNYSKSVKGNKWDSSWRELWSYIRLTAVPDNCNLNRLI